ncbi:MAG: hypothetical protein M1839_002990 [Geoglossum umbratile]|nr:MAG: hypothetical protein M1839_002990 [Geoglossum umbratile]
MSSPPPTPTEDSQRRFYSLRMPTEWIEEYKPGGLHPVHLGDVFDNGRYRVIRKLGDGSFSTVWLAVDGRLCRYVALKIVRAADSAKNKEESVISQLSEFARKDSVTPCFAALLDHFYHEGPNGSHLCLAFEPMGPSVERMAEAFLPIEHHSALRDRPRFPVWTAKQILKQSLQGLEFLHRHGFTHAGFHPGNLLFTVSTLDSIPEEQLQQSLEYNSVSEPVKRLDGKVDKWAPRYLAFSQPLLAYTDIKPGFTIKLTDMAEAFRSADPPGEQPYIPIDLTAPELFLDRPFNEKIDIWSFGCLAYEFLTAARLFQQEYSNREDWFDEHFLQMNQILGDLPDGIFSQWPRAHEYFDENREPIPWTQIRTPSQGEAKSPSDECNIEGLRVGDDGEGPGVEGAAVSKVESDRCVESGGQSQGDGDVEQLYLKGPRGRVVRLPPLDKLFQLQRHKDIGDAEAAEILSLIREALQYEPEKRATAAQLLQNPWFSRTY